MRRYAFAVIVMLSCLGPTEITVTITTDAVCGDLGGVGVSIGTPGTIDDAPIVAKTTGCDDAGAVGSIVVLPSSAIDDDVAIRVTAGFGRPVESCVAPFGPQCIVSRRSLHYLPHTPLYLPVFLGVSCAGVPCDSTSTCQAGTCVPADVPDSGACVTQQGCADAGAPLEPFGADCGDMSGAQFGSSWPMTAGCPRHLSRTPFHGPTTLPQSQWARGIGTGPVLSIPVVTRDGLFIVGSPDSDVYVLDAAGQQLGTLGVPGVFWGNGALVADGTLVIGGDGVVVGADPETRSVLWQFSASPSDLTVGPGQVVYYGEGVSLFARHAATGDIALQVDCATTAMGFSAPAIGPDGTIYLSGDTTLCAIDPVARVVKWQLPFAGRGAPLVTPDGTVYLPVPNDAVHALPPGGGAEKWSYPGAAAGFLALGPSGEIVAGTTTGLVGLDAKTGAVVWQFANGDAVNGTLVVDGAGNVFASTSAGNVVAVDPKNASQPLWLLPIAGGANTVMLAGDGTIVVGTRIGSVLGYR